MHVAVLSHAEPVVLDRDQLDVLYRQLGPVGADRVVTHALAELSTLLESLAVDYRAVRVSEVAGGARALAAVAQQVGMLKLARVARDVAELAHGRDAAALGAVMARLDRIGDRSIIAVWDEPGTGG